MRVRKRFLPPGWYPSGAEQTREAIEGMRPPPPSLPPAAIAGVAPHAGWGYSGALALGVFSRISRAVDTIVIIGGHLGPSDGILAAFEDAYDTPLGPVEADGELLSALRGTLSLREDRVPDNTVEVQLPLLRHLFPGVRALALRAPPSGEAVALGEALAGLSSARRRIAVVGSTDLTHYGSNYGFLPAGRGEKALRWVREVNDRRFVECLLSLDAAAAIERAVKEKSACSAGGAAAAVSFARGMGCARGTLVEYMTSSDVTPGESFVGYAAVVYDLEDRREPEAVPRGPSS